jgi:ESCRT-II complex subunit VPS36
VVVVRRYCLYNRARGSSVISPEELVEACENWARLPTAGTKSNALVLHAFPSGVKVIRQAAHTDAVVFKRLEALLADDGGDSDGGGGGGRWKALSAMEVSARLRVGLLIAQEYLVGAEAAGVLARDDTAEGLYFYRNEFGA